MSDMDDSITVRLEKVLVADSFIGHAEFIVGILAEIRGWSASKPVRLVTTPAICESWYMTFGLQVDA